MDEKCFIIKSIIEGIIMSIVSLSFIVLQFCYHILSMNNITEIILFIYSVFFLSISLIHSIAPTYICQILKVKLCLITQPNGKATIFILIGFIYLASPNLPLIIINYVLIAIGIYLIIINCFIPYQISKTLVVPATKAQLQTVQMTITTESNQSTNIPNINIPPPQEQQIV